MSRLAFRALVWCTCFLPASALFAAQPAIRAGAEFQVNTVTFSSQFRPRAAMDADGDFVVVWASSFQDADNSAGILGRRFDSSGSALASPFEVNVYTTNDQNRPDVDMMPDGRFVVVWQSFGQDGSGFGVWGRRFDPAGSAIGDEFHVSALTLGGQDEPRVAFDGSGGFVVVWEAQFDSYGNGVFGQRYDSAGAPLSTELLVNDDTLFDQEYPAIARTGSGGFVVAWRARTLAAGSRIVARRFDAAFTGLASEFQVSQWSTATQSLPTVAMNGAGDFVVAWRSTDQDGAVEGVFTRRFDSGGAALTDELQVNTHTLDSQSYPSVAMGASGDFVVVWRSQSQDGSSHGVFAQQFAGSGTPVASEFQVNTYTSGAQTLPTLAMNAGGDFVVTWHGAEQDGSAYGVFAQRFEALGAIDIDGDGETEPLTDGLLTMRHLFGFTGAVLTGGAVDLDDCTRCDAEAIEAYLATLN